MAERIFSARPEIMRGLTDSVETPLGRAYVTLNFYEGEPREVFVVLGKAGTTERAAAEAVGRLCSIALQHGTPLEELIRQLRGISSAMAYGLGPNKILSFPDAVAQALDKIASMSYLHIQEDEPKQEDT